MVSSWDLVAAWGIATRTERERRIASRTLRTLRSTRAILGNERERDRHLVRSFRSFVVVNKAAIVQNLVSLAFDNFLKV